MSTILVTGGAGFSSGRPLSGLNLRSRLASTETRFGSQP
jgi:hypothetical protein